MNKYLEKIAAFTTSKGRSVKDGYDILGDHITQFNNSQDKIRLQGGEGLVGLGQSPEAQRQALGAAGLRHSRIDIAKGLIDKKKTGIRNTKIGLGLGAAALGIAAYEGLKNRD